MRYLITGGAGFIGSHLAELLVARGDEVIALDDLSTGSAGNLAALAGSPRFRLVIGSVLDPAAIEPLVAACDGVFHLAAAVGVRMVVESPVHTLRTNVVGTECVLHAATVRAGGVIPVLVASSSEVYGKGGAARLREDAELVLGATTTARWGYACSKAMDEFMALAYARDFALPVVVARLFNTVGPRQTGRHGMVVPRFVSQALAGGPITVHGDGAQSRCFAHVRDVTSALAALAAHPGARGGVFNVGNDEEVTMRALAERVRHKVDPACEIAHVTHEAVYGAGFEDVERRVPDLAKLRALVGSSASRSTPLEQILDDVIAHERAQRG